MITFKFWNKKLKKYCYGDYYVDDERNVYYMHEKDNYGNLMKAEDIEVAYFENGVWLMGR